MYPAKEAISSRNNIPLIGSVLIYRGRIRNSRHARPARTNFDMILGKEKQVLSASSGLWGRALYHRVHNYASRQTKCSDISIENSASVWI